MKHLVLMLGAMLLLISPSIAQTLSQNQRKNVIARVEAYKNYLIKYSGSSKKLNDVKDSLGAMFSLDATHAIDLGRQYKGGVRSEPIDNYITKVANDFNHDVDIRFTQGQLINCIDTCNGKTAIYVTEKCVAQKGRVDVYSEVVQVDLPENENDYANYKIIAVWFAADFKYDKNTHYECANQIEVRTEDTEKANAQDSADHLFYNDRFEDAMEAYLFMADRYPNDDYPRFMLSTCRVSVKDDSIFLKHGKKFFSEKNYARAINWYTGHLVSFPNDTNTQHWLVDTINYIRRISAEENYIAYMAKALTSCKLHNFGNACYYYGNALKFRPGDAVALDSLRQTQYKDVNYANNKIDSAIRLYKENKADNAGIYFKILDEYGSYGNHIGTEQYLHLAYLLYNYDLRVIAVMHLENNKKFKAYRKKYYDNLAVAYNHETNKAIRAKVKFFIEELVN